MPVTMLYFAWVREAIGIGEERVDPPEAVTTVDALIDWLASQSEGHARALADRTRLRAAIDQAFVPFDAPIAGAREIAIFPPGDRRMIRVVVQAGPIDLADALAGAEVAGAGGVASFTGIVRGDDGVTALTLEHYPGMTEAALRAVADEAQARWALLAITIIHRVGTMTPGERVVFVAVAAAHRAAALDACAFAIDRLKTSAPFWKREQRGNAAAWVEPRAADDAAAARWSDR